MFVNLELSAGGPSGERPNLVELVEATESAGFHGVGFTDHPAPSRKWLEHGGHATYDPFAALAFVAGISVRLRLMTYLAVLPYRNPLLTLKLITTVDRLSAGRFTLVAGVGYLRSEFSALGVSFEDRRAATDEALEVLTAAARGPLSFVGRAFEARDQVCVPGPVQEPLPPIWIGGTSRASLERAARYGHGWAPILSTEQSAQTTRSAPMTTVADCARKIQGLRQLVEDQGRDPGEVSVQLDGVFDLRQAAAEPDHCLEILEEMAAVGVTHCMTRAPFDATHEEAVDLIRSFGEETLPRVGPDTLASSASDEPSLPQAMRPGSHPRKPPATSQ